MLIDLQFHSTYSDGSFTPTKLVNWLAKNKVKVASLTDHNTVAGLDEFFRACRKKKIKPIPGIELYARYGSRKLNLLFYNFDQDNPHFHDFLRKTQIQRARNVAKALEYWQKRGMEIDVPEILASYNHYIPINGVIKHLKKSTHNLDIMREDLHEKNPQEWQIIKHYFKTREIYYLSETYVDIHRLEELQKKIGGQVIIAHPAKNRISVETIERLMDHKLIDGIEVLSAHHGWDSISRLLYIMQKYKKAIISGGSDFHRPDRNSFGIDSAWNFFKIDSKYLRNIDKIIK